MILRKNSSSKILFIYFLLYIDQIFKYIWPNLLDKVRQIYIFIITEFLSTTLFVLLNQSLFSKIYNFMII